jgi:hypothetical protein
MDQLKFRPGDVSGRVLNAVTTGTSQAIAFNDCRRVNWIVEGSAGVGAGAVTIETANDSAYGGTWAQVAAPITVVASAQLQGSADVPPGGWVRARVSTNVTGGTATVWLNGLQVP